MAEDGAVVGTCDARFDGVRAEFARRLASGEELGAAIAVDLDGETVLDLHGGWRDEARPVPWTADTLVNVWSTTKTVTNLAALVCVERGLLDVYAPVAEYWPEFAQAGKERVEVRTCSATRRASPGSSSRPWSRTSTTCPPPRSGSPPRPRGGSRGRHRATTR